MNEALDTFGFGKLLGHGFVAALKFSPREPMEAAMYPLVDNDRC